MKRLQTSANVQLHRSPCSIFEIEIEIAIVAHQADLCRTATRQFTSKGVTMIIKFTICRSEYRRMLLPGILALLFAVSGTALKAGALPENSDEATISEANAGHTKPSCKPDPPGCSCDLPPTCIAMP